MMPPKDIAAPHKRRPFDVDAFVIALDGEFDIAERVRLLDAFAVTTSSPLVVIDFEKTRYIDSTVLECLVALERAISERGAQLILVALQPQIRRIVDVCGLDRLFDIRDRATDVTTAFGIDSASIRRLALIAEPSLVSGAETPLSEG